MSCGSSHFVMRRFIFVMRLMAFDHAAFSFRHAAFCRRSWGVWLRPSHLSSPPDSAVRCRAVLSAVQYVGGAVLSTVPCWVLFNTWAVPAQLCSQYGKCRWLSCPTRSTITRLPSGSSISRSGAFRDGALSVGAGTAHRCTGALAVHRRIPTLPVTFRSA